MQALAIGALAVVVLTIVALVWAHSVRSSHPSQPVILTHHARQRMDQRGVDEADLMLTLARPDSTRPDSKQDSICYERVFGERTLKVWVAAANGGCKELVVKSTAWSFVLHFTIARTGIGSVIGRHGATIHSIELRSHTLIRVEESGSVTVSASGRDDAVLAQSLVMEAVAGAAERNRRPRGHARATAA